MPEFLTLEEVASTLRIQPRSLQIALQRGTTKLVHLRVGARVLIPKTAFEQLLADSLVVN